MLERISAYNCWLKVEVNEYDLFTGKGFPRETLEQLQQSVQWTFQRERAASTETEGIIWSLIVNKGDEQHDRRIGEEESVRYTSVSALLIGYME